MEEYKDIKMLVKNKQRITGTKNEEGLVRVFGYGLNELDWRDYYSSLREYYDLEYGHKYNILDIETLEPLPDSKQYPYYTFDDYEYEIDPNESKEEIEAYDFDRQLEEIRKCITSFPYFCHKYVKIAHPIRGLVPFVLFNYQRRTIKEYGNHRFNIISKFRQGGLTTVTAIWGGWRCMFKRNETIMVMSKTDREACHAGEMISRMIDFLPGWMRDAFCKLRKANDHVKVFEGTGSRIEFQGPEAARSKSLTYMIIDEAAHIDNMEKHWKAMYPTLATGGSCVAISTVNGLGNWYEETYHRAEAGRNKFHIIELDFWEHPDYNDPIWVEDTKAQLTQKGWDQEVMRSFLSSGDTYIPGNVLIELENSIRSYQGDGYRMPKRFIYPEWQNEATDTQPLFYKDRGALWIFKEPNDGHTYTMAVDTAEGVGPAGDNSCFQIIDDLTLEQVAEFYSNNINPHTYSQIINEVGIYYNNARVVVEHMAPPGGAVCSALVNSMMYENLYYDPNARKKNPTPGLKTNLTLRPSVLERLQNRLLEGAVKVNSPRLIHELKTFIWHSGRNRAEAQPGKHDDAIMSLALAIYVRDTSMRDIPVGAPIPQELKRVFETEVYEDIRRQLKDGAPEDWITDDDDDMFSDPDVMPGVVFNVRRKYDKLLKEFDW